VGASPKLSLCSVEELVVFCLFTLSHSYSFSKWLVQCSMRCCSWDSVRTSKLASSAVNRTSRRRWIEIAGQMSQLVICTTLLLEAEARCSLCYCACQSLVNSFPKCIEVQVTNSHSALFCRISLLSSTPTSHSSARFTTLMSLPCRSASLSCTPVTLCKSVTSAS
jgi:hypothetical protein